MGRLNNQPKAIKRRSIYPARYLENLVLVLNVTEMRFQMAHQRQKLREPEDLWVINVLE